MESNQQKSIKTGILAITLFFILEFILDINFSSHFPGYNWQEQSLSYLGQSGSPIEHWVMLWGVGFTVLVLLFAYAFYQVFKNNFWGKMGTLFLVLYALGEGLGSGCFPINPPDTPLTLDARLHNILSGIGDAGLVLLPFAMMFLFPKKEHRKFHFYLWSVVGIGLCMASFFLIAKYYQPDNFILHFKGVWQRVYLFNYHLMLVVVGVIMWRSISQND